MPVIHGRRGDPRISSHGGTASPGGRAVDAGIDANIRSAVSADVVLVGAELAALSGDALQLLLGWSVCVTDLHEHSLVANRSTVVFLNDFLALLASLEPIRKSDDSQ